VQKEQAMTEKKKPRGRAFAKGDDPRRAVRKPDTSTRELRELLLRAASTVGNRLAEVSNARLPKRPNRNFSREVLGLLRRDPRGTESYFEWLAEFHPKLFVGLLVRYVPQAVQEERGPELKVTHRSPEQVEQMIRDLGLPPLQQAFQLPKRIDLHNPPDPDADDDNIIDVTPTESS
jgi:hypothetical protein